MSRHLHIVRDGDENRESRSGGTPDRPRCPRCSSWQLTRTNAGWWCENNACGLVSTGSPDEWDAMLGERLLWARGKHPAQRAHEPAPPAPRLPGSAGPCETCGEHHAVRPARGGEAPHMTRGRHAPRTRPDRKER